MHDEFELQPVFQLRPPPPSIVASQLERVGPVMTQHLTPCACYATMRDVHVRHAMPQPQGRGRPPTFMHAYVVIRCSHLVRGAPAYAAACQLVVAGHAREGTEPSRPAECMCGRLCAMCARLDALCRLCIPQWVMAGLLLLSVMVSYLPTYRTSDFHGVIAMC